MAGPLTLIRGASAGKVLESGMPATVFTSSQEEGDSMAAVMIGAGPHKASHTAVAIDAAEEPLGQLRVRAAAAQAERLLAWAQAWPQRTWAIEGAGGLGHLLAQQLLAAGERVLDVQPKLAARVRLLAGPLLGGGVHLVAFSGSKYIEADGPLLDAAALPEGEWVTLEFALDRTPTATFDRSRVTASAVRLRSGSAVTGGAFASDGRATIIEIDNVAD